MGLHVHWALWHLFSHLGCGQLLEDCFLPGVVGMHTTEQTRGNNSLLEAQFCDTLIIPKCHHNQHAGAGTTDREVRCNFTGMGSSSSRDCSVH